MKRGYFGIGIEHTKNSVNVGTLWRSAALMGASFIFTIGRRYTQQASDTIKAWRHVPLYNYATFDGFYKQMPHDCRLVGVELDDSAVSLGDYAHWERAVYLLGAEDHGLTEEAHNRVHDLIVIPTPHSLNVAVTGSIVMYDRSIKQPWRNHRRKSA